MTDIIEPNPADIRLPNGRFSAGNPGKPKGAKSKSTVLRGAIEKALMAASADGDGNALDQMIEKQVRAAIAGDLNAFVALMSYWAGRPRQADPADEKDLKGAVAQLLDMIQENPASDHRPNADMVTSADDEETE